MVERFQYARLQLTTGGCLYNMLLNLNLTTTAATIVHYWGIFGKLGSTSSAPKINTIDISLEASHDSNISKY